MDGNTHPRKPFKDDATIANQFQIMLSSHIAEATNLSNNKIRVVNLLNDPYFQIRKTTQKQKD